MNEELEIIDLDGLEFEEIEKAVSEYPFPTITLSSPNLFFNRAAGKYLKDVQFVKFRTSTEYVVIVPTEEKTKTAFKLGTYTNGAKAIAYPANLKGCKIKRGVYKLYKYKDGFAFKRYEPLKLL